MAYTLTYTLNSDGNSYTLSGYSGDKPTGALAIPDSYDSKPVTIIGGRAFQNCSGLTSITIGSSLISIGNFAFYNCSGLTSVTIGNSVTSIYNYAFSGCTSLTTITIPDSVTSIGNSAFQNCSSLTNITIPDSVTSIGDYAFAGCIELTSITIPDSVTSIGGSAFQNCSGLTRVTIGIGVTSIGTSMFEGCTGLTSVTIGSGVTSIGSYAFSGCTGLTSIEVASGNTKYHSNGNCLIETETKILILGCKTSIIPADGSVTSIGGRAFSGCTGLTSVVIPDSVTGIAEAAFDGCTGLISLTIGSSLISIDNFAFYRCSSLVSVTIPNSVTSIGDSSFSRCSSLTKINLLPTTPPTIQNDALDATVQNIYVPAQSREAYKTATNWNTYADKIIEFPILDLGSLLMYNNKVKAKIDAIEEKKRDKNDGSGISNPNLLINPDFSINQRGQKSYAGTGYGVDRWKNSYGTLELQSNGEIKHTSSNAWQGVAQYIENPSRLAGKTVTISAMGRVEGATAFRIYLYYQIGNNARATVCDASTTSTTNTIISASGTIPADITDNDKLYFMLYNATANTSFYCKWAKLEIGSVATVFSPPSIAEELPKCQRYYQRYAFKNDMPLPLGVARNERTVSINFNIPKLRTTPTFATSGTVKLLNQNITGLTLKNNQYYDGVYRMFVETSGLTAGTGILIAGDIDGYYAFDAEIY